MKRASITFLLTVLAFSYTYGGIEVQNLEAAVSCPGPTVTSGLVSHWDLDGDADEVSGGDDGTISGNPTFVTGQVDEVLSFDGTTDYVRIPNESNYDFIGQEFTVSGWFKTSSNGRMALIAKQLSADTQWVVEVRAANDLAAYLVQTNGSNTLFMRRTDQTVNDGEWHHFATTMDTSNPENVRLWVDGIEETTINTDLSGSQNYNTDSTAEVVMGGFPDVGGILYYTGQLDQMRIYNDALTEDEIRAIYINESGGCSPLTSITDTLSRQKISTASNHTIQFTTPGGVAEAQTIDMTFPAGFDLSSIVENDVDITDDSTDLTTATSCSGSEEAGISVSGQVLTIEICDGDGGAIAASSVIQIQIGDHADASGSGSNQIENPSSADSYTIEIDGTFGDAGNVSVNIQDDDQVTVTAEVAPSITFDIDVGIASGETAAPYGVSLGELSTGSIKTSNNSNIASIFLELTTNATGGAIVTVEGTNGGLSSTTANNTITTSDGGSATALSAGSEGFGLCVTDTNETSGGPIVAVAPYNGTCDSSNHNVGGLTTSPRTIINSSDTGVAGTANDTAEIMVKAAISAGTEGADDYEEEIIFVAVGTF